MNNYKPKMVVGTKYKKLGDQKNTANAWGDWDPEKYVRCHPGGKLGELRENEK